MTQEQLRPFRFWEQICSTMNLSLAFELQGPVSEELVSKAWSLITKEYPYFASTIVQDEQGQLLFKSPATETDPFIDVYSNAPVEWIKHSLVLDWRPLLVAFANCQRDHSTALAHLQLHSSGPDRHVLLATVNHAGVDGLSIFHVFRSFFSKLGELACGYEPPLRGIKPNVDIGARVPPVDAARLQPVQVPEGHMPMLAPAAEEAATAELPYVAAEFGELSASETARLIAKCREGRATIQGAVSAAAAVAMAQAQRFERRLPQTLLMQCPANMRRQVQPAFDDDEPSCAASFLWWPQLLAAEQTLWDVARAATDSIRRESEHFGGMAFWARLHASKTLPELATAGTPPYSPPYTVTASSVGINPIPVDNGPIKVLTAHMMLSTFGITSATEAGSMTHAHTFGNRLHVTFTYNMPAVGHKRGRAMAGAQLAVLQVLASDNPDVTVGDFVACMTSS